MFVRNSQYWNPGQRLPCADHLVPIQKRSFRPISALCSKFYPRNIMYMPAVKFFACLELERKSTILDGHYLTRTECSWIQVVVMVGTKRRTHPTLHSICTFRGRGIFYRGHGPLLQRKFRERAMPENVKNRRIKNWPDPGHQTWYTYPWPVCRPRPRPERPRGQNYRGWWPGG